MGQPAPQPSGQSGPYASQPSVPFQQPAAPWQAQQPYSQPAPVAPVQPVSTPVAAQPWQTPPAPVYSQPVYAQPVSQPQPVQPWAPNQQAVYGASTPQFQFAQQQNLAALAKLRKKVIRIMVAVALFMGISAGVIILLAAAGTGASGYSQSDLTTYSQDGVSFQYPRQWLDIHSQVSDAQAAFGDNANLDSANAIITVQSEDNGFGPLDSLTDSQINEFKSTLKDETKSSLFRDTLEADSGCVTVDSNTVDDAPSDFSLKGVKFTFTCSRANKQQLTVEGYIGIASDGKVYIIQIIGLDSAFQDNQDVFDSMLNSLKVG